MLVGPSLLLALSRVGPDPRPSNAWAFPAAGAVFASGWVLVGASLRPAGSAWCGAAAAAVAYVVVGLLWVVGFNTALGTPPSRLARVPTGEDLLLVLIWPLQVAQALGLFGLGFR